MTTITFRVICHTRWGQEVYVNVDGNVQKLETSDGFTWSRNLQVNPGVAITYGYEIHEENAVEQEFGDLRNLHLPMGSQPVLVSDTWRSPGSLDNVLYSAPFEKSIFIRKKAIDHGQGGGDFLINLRAIRIPPNMQVGILGSSEELGSWDPDRLFLLAANSFPIWSINLHLPVSKSFEYKYVLCDENGKLIQWEFGENRRFDPLKNFEKYVINDEYARFYDAEWRGSGIVLPVFSLRTEQSGGVGEFTDIPVAIDWMKKVGFKVFQTLPVNDTVASHTWWDSYPYAAISVHALHPAYANMETIGPLKDKRKWDKLQKDAKALNLKEEFDYEAVMKMKSAFFKLSYDENKDEFLKSKALKTFLEANKKWIHDYAAFSCLRDRFKTPEFNQWGEYSYLSDREVMEFTSPKQKYYDDVAVHYYIQYHLDKQLREATAYGRKNGVVLKGDIPIGIFRYSVDAWRRPDLFHLDQQAGAPPDMFSTTGQNWGFPTYNWNEMAKDGYAWWRDRLQKMSEYFDMIRLDHILGFFRIWQMPADQVQGLLGTFYPSLPLSVEEIKSWGIHLDPEEYSKPTISPKQLDTLHHKDLIEKYLLTKIDGSWVIPDEMESQHRVNQKIHKLIKEKEINENVFDSLQKEFFKLQSEVLFIKDKDSGNYHPRIDLHHTFRYAQLDQDQKWRLKDLHDYYFYRRHNEFWRQNAIKKLPVIRDASDMLMCGEDLGFVPASVGPLMNELQILQLDVERAPGYPEGFKSLHYLSVKGTGNHDMLTLRQWWHEVPEESHRVYHDILRLSGHTPGEIDPEIAEMLLELHLEANSMWVIFPLQDLTLLAPELMRANMDAERINVPENPKNVWKYRFHMNLEELMDKEDFNKKLRQLIERNGRG
ncbi:MAG: 4-alpha-glucanotransferase [Bacteroidota bacterium]